MLKTIWKFANSLRSDSANFQINAKSRPLSFSKPPANGRHPSVIPAAGLMMMSKGGERRLDLPGGQIGVRLLGKRREGGLDPPEADRREIVEEKRERM